MRHSSRRAQSSTQKRARAAQARDDEESDSDVETSATKSKRLTVSEASSHRFAPLMLTHGVISATNRQPRRKGNKRRRLFLPPTTRLRRTRVSNTTRLRNQMDPDPSFRRPTTRTLTSSSSPLHASWLTRPALLPPTWTKPKAIWSRLPSRNLYVRPALP
jgi:hypothetical protein